MLKENQILVIIKNPGEKPHVEPLFDNTLEAFQAAVGGYIETVRIAADLLLIVNEEGAIRNDVEYNCRVCGMPIFGPIVAVRPRGENFGSLKATSVPVVLKILDRDT